MTDAYTSLRVMMRSIECYEDYVMGLIGNGYGGRVCSTGAAESIYLTALQSIERIKRLATLQRNGSNGGGGRNADKQ